MHLMTYDHEDERHLAILAGDTLIVPSLINGWPSELDSVLAVIDGGLPVRMRLQQLVADPPAAARIPFEPARLAAPIPRPRKNMICLGWNYADHAKESAAASKREYELPEYPVVFTKGVTSVTGPYADIPFDRRLSTKIDWEVELGVVIGVGGRRIAAEDALGHVFGYTVVNDISARDIQKRHKQFFLGKSLDASSPMGPSIVTADEIPDPQRLGLRCWVNGALKQESHTSVQIFSVAQTISILSQVMTLDPGDIIATGTPSGVGFARTPPEFLSPDDLVECEVEGIGRLKNKVVARTA
jgi:2-keto-4-pentenoate hydratase/2-oxohepta-3-ene-1,7-dioic acid hydratase in catechol pathway